jgi:hypothetical protein
VFTARYELCPLHKTDTFRFIWFKEKFIANTNLYVTQVDSIAARGSCIFLRVLLRDSFDLRHAVKKDIKKYVTLNSIL